MALSTFMPRLYARLAIAHLFTGTGWLMNVDDRSSELMGTNTKISYPDFRTRVAVRDYTRHTDMVDQRMVDKYYNLRISQRKYISVAIDTLEERENYAAIVGEWAQYSGRELRRAVDTYLRGRFEADIASVTEVADDGEETSGAAEKIRTFDLAINVAGATGADKIPFGTEVYRKALVEQLYAVKMEAMRRAWPDNAFMACSPQIYIEFAKYLGLDRDGTLALADRQAMAFIDAEISKLVGFTPMLDFRYSAAVPSADADTFPGGTQGNAGAMYYPMADEQDMTKPVTDVEKIYFGIPNDTLRFAQKVRDAKTEVIQSQFGMRHSALWTYGATVVDNEKRMMLQHDVAA